LVEGYAEERHCQGWCRKYYTRWHKHGDVDAVLKGGISHEFRACEMPGCERKHLAAVRL
jgi:hypothetical protein